MPEKYKPTATFGWAYQGGEDVSRTYEDDILHYFQLGHAICDSRLTTEEREDPHALDPSGRIPVNDGLFCKKCLKVYSGMLVRRLPEEQQRFVRTYCNKGGVDGGCGSGHLHGECIHIWECTAEMLEKGGYLMPESYLDEDHDGIWRQRHHKVEDYTAITEKKGKGT